MECCARELATRDARDAASPVDIERLGETDQTESVGDRARRMHCNVWNVVCAQEVSRVGLRIVDVDTDEDNAAAA
jgi:hypothetical protein